MDGRNEPSPSNEKQSIRLESIVQQRLGSMDGLPNRVLLISPNRWIFHPHLETYTTWSNDVSSYGRCHLGNQRKQSLYERYFLLCWFWHQMDRLSWWKTCWWLIQMEFCKLVHLCLTSHLFLFRCPHSVMCNHWYSLYACFLGVYSALFHDLYDDVLCGRTNSLSFHDWWIRIEVLYGK